MDLRERRELNNGFGNALSRAVEIAVTPIIFGFFGYLLDGRLGTRPIFMLVFGVLVFGYAVWKQYALYNVAMEKEQRKVMGGREEGTR